MIRRPPCLTILLSLSLFLGTLLPLAQPAAARPCAADQLLDEVAASDILATERPFTPANRDLFASYVSAEWADARPLQDPQGPALTEQEINDDLRAFLERRFPCSPERVRDGLGVYASPTARHKIPDPTLRAALAALTGTLGEPAIDFLLDQAPVSTIHFGVIVSQGQGFPRRMTAYTFVYPDRTWEIIFDGRLRFSPFGIFSALLFHEALHVESPPADRAAGDKSDNVGLPEEATAVALESLAYMQMILTDPTLARQPDIFTRAANNYMTLLRLNSGPAGTDRLNLFLPDSDTNIDPLAPTPLTEFFEYYPQRIYPGPATPQWREFETHGNPLLAAVLPSLAEDGHTPPAQPDYDRATLEYIDQNQGVLSPGQLVAVACVLELDVPCS